MINATTYENIIKALGKVLDDYSGLLAANIQNADSARGTDISQKITPVEAYSPTLSDSFMLFELIESPDGEHYVTKDEIKENKQSMTTIQSYDYHLMIYGNHSPIDAQKISSIFKRENIALSLHEKGIFITGVGGIEAINEFINNTLVLRRDLIIKIEARYIFESTEDVQYFDQNQEVGLIVKNVAEIKVS